MWHCSWANTQFVVILFMIKYTVRCDTVHDQKHCSWAHTLFGMTLYLIKYTIRRDTMVWRQVICVTMNVIKYVIKYTVVRDTERDKNTTALNCAWSNILFCVALYAIKYIVLEGFVRDQIHCSEWHCTRLNTLFGDQINILFGVTLCVIKYTHFETWRCGQTFVTLSSSVLCSV